MKMFSIWCIFQFGIFRYWVKFYYLWQHCSGGSSALVQRRPVEAVICLLTWAATSETCSTSWTAATPGASPGRTLRRSVRSWSWTLCPPPEPPPPRLAFPGCPATSPGPAHPPRPSGQCIQGIKKINALLLWRPISLVWKQLLKKVMSCRDPHSFIHPIPDFIWIWTLADFEL